MPARFTIPLTSAVATISRRSGCGAMPVDEALAQRGGEVAARARREVGVVEQRRLEQLLLERDLRVGEQHGELGNGEAEPGVAPAGERLVVGQELDRAVELLLLLERAHEPRVHAGHSGACALASSSAWFWRSLSASTSAATSSVIDCEQRVAFVAA